MVRLERLAIRKYRRLAPGTELRFSPHHNVLLGKNASGKTTLLDLIACVVSLDFSNLRDEAFDIEFEFWDGETRLLWMELRNVAKPTELPGGHGRSRAFEASARIELANGRRVLVQADATTVEEAGRPPQPRTPLALMGDNAAWAAELWRSLRDFPGELLTWPPVVRVDEGLTVFERILSRAGVAWNRLEIDDEQGGVMDWSYRGLWPVAGTSEDDLSRVLDDGQVIVSREALPMLEALAEAMELRAVDVVLSPVSTANGTLSLGNLQFRCTRRDGSIDTNSTLSYGERRMIALWWCLACTPHVAVIDELVNGLHHSWIEATMRRLDGRQSFLTSQNPLLMDYLGFGSADDVQRTFMLCAGLSGTSSDLAIRNLTAEEASRFYAAHAVGIQHVSEILRDQGLW